MTRPSRATVAGRVYLDLRNQARHDRRPVDELLQLYVLEAFLARLADSPLVSRLVLKGGVLMAAFEERQPTRDVDLQAHALDNDADSVRRAIGEIAGRNVDDGVVFDVASAKVAVIRDEDAYNGIRVTMRAELATAEPHFHVDINVGDPITPGPQMVHIPRLLGGEVVVQGYPLVMVHAEKVVTAISRGTVSTRWRDFADVYLLVRRHPVDGAELTEAIRRVARHRGVEPVPLARVLDGYAEIGQARWAAWRVRQRLDERIPGQFAAAVSAMIEFADPAIAGKVSSRSWSPSSGSWL